MTSLIFRPATPTDSPAIAALHFLSWQYNYRDIIPASYFANPQHALDRAEAWRQRLALLAQGRIGVYVAEQGAELVGFACVLLDMEPAWGGCLDNLHVRPGMTGQAIGRRLFANAARWMLAAAPTYPLHLWVYEQNGDARRFYDRYGGEVAERALKMAPGGAMEPLLRYVWRDVAGLVGALD